VKKYTPEIKFLLKTCNAVMQNRKTAVQWSNYAKYYYADEVNVSKEEQKVLKCENFGFDSE